ncbi:MAG: hypothetical protein WCI04_03105 [archaeon]
MNNKNITVGVLVVLIIAGVAIWAAMSIGSYSSTNPVTGLTAGITTGSQTSTTAPSLKFSSSPDFANAYEILPTKGPNTDAALSGFNLSQSPKPNSSTQVTISSSEYNINRTINVAPGYSFFIIEKMMGDDSTGEEKNLRDDYFVLVNENGYISQEFHPTN